MPYIPPENELDYLIDEDESEEELETIDDDDNENEADYTSYEYSGPDDIGVPDPDSSGDTPISEEPEETQYVVTYKDRVLLSNFEPSYLYELFQNGAKFYAIYDDDSEEEVSWDEIEDLNPLDTIVDLSEAIASATNQHFWNDDQGVHVAEINKESWQTAMESNFSDLSNSKNYYNLLTNSLGLLFRRALYNLVSITRTAISFYDGLGNESSNVMAYFGRDSAQIGRSNSKHLSLDSEGITAYNADGTVAPLQAANITAAEANIEQLQTATADISTIRANSAKVASLTAEALTAATAYIAALNTLNVTANDISANKATLGSLITGSVTTDTLKAASAYISALNSANVTANDISANKATLNSLIAGDVTADTLRAASAYIAALTSASVTANDISANKATLNSLIAGDVTADTLRAASAYIAALTSASVTANDISANKATLGALIAGNVTTDTLRAASAYISSLTASNISASTLTADHANVTTIIADYLTSADIQAEQIRVGQLLAGYVETDFSNADVAWIENGTIKDGAITNAMINSVSANKLTAGTIDASNITVTNLNADNITTGTINGQRIGEGSLSLSKLEDDVYTETEVDTMLSTIDATLSTMQAEIDGAIETWTGTAVPTLSNAPASGWTTNAVKDTHVGDVYFVVNSQSQQNGYNYRFTKSGNGSSATYSWQLIKDNDVTNALQRLTTAEGKITTFDSDISQLKTDTGSLTTRTTTLETRTDGIDSTLLDKVDVTDFNSLEDTVDGHTQTLSQHTTAISNKADNSTVTAVTNRVSQNEQNISGITTRVGSLETTVATKADNSTVTTVSNNLSTLSQTVDSFQSTVASTYATKESVNGIQVGGRNLLRSTPTVYNKTDYLVYRIPTSVSLDEFSAGDNITLQLWGVDLDSGSSGLRAYWGGGSVCITDTLFSPDATGHVLVIIDILQRWLDHADASNKLICIYNFPGNHTGSSLTIDHWKLEKGNKGTDWTPSPEDNDAKYTFKDESYADYLKTQSRGEQLITNGNGMMGDNTNFSMLMFDGSKSNGSPGSFTKSSGYSEIWMDEYFPVDPSKEYEASFDVLSSGDGANSRMYAQLNMYDVDKKRITVQCVSYYPNTTTTLAQDLKPEDTIVHLTDASNWHTTSAPHQRSLIFWNYTNSAGYLYPIGTYSRNYYAGVYENDSSVDKQAGTITLSSPWSGETIAAGTPVSQNTSGGSYAYFWIDSNGSKILVDEWLHVSGLYSGTKGPQGVNSSVPPSTSFWHGTAYCKIGWLWNYQSSTTGTQRRLWITNVSMKIKNASIADVNAAVEAIPRMAKINMASRNFTLSQWNNYGAVGHVENWSTGATYDNSHLRIGDRAYLIGTISDKNAGSATIIGEVTKVVPTGVGTSYVTLKTEQLIFGGDVVTAVESRVTTAESTIEQHDASIALKANSADVYTKTQSDGLISTEVTNRNAAISAATDAINLSVSQTYSTKTEVGEVADRIVGRNLLPSSVISGEVEGGSTEEFSLSPAQLRAHFGNGKYFWDEFEENTQYTFSVSALRSSINETFTGDGPIFYFAYEDDSEASEMRFSRGAAGLVRKSLTSKAGKTVSKLYASYSSDASVLWTYFDLKLEKGAVATEWSAAPEDYTDKQVTAAKAAIKVTTDGITSEVEKKTDKTSIISTINQSAESVKIQASKIDITGEAVFSAINNDTGTTKINGGKIDATAITIGQSQVTGLATALNGKADDSDISAIQDDLNSSRVWYAVCDTVAATVAKVATISPATTDFTLEIGRMVNVRFVNTNTGAVGSLTLNVNDTGAKPIKNFYNGGVSTLSAAGYLKANSIITFKYDGTNWIADLTVNSTYNQGVNQLYNAIKAKTSITAQSIIVGDANGYSMAAAGVSFDLAYPILWTTANIAANETNYASVFTSHYNLDLATNHGFSSGTPNSIVYLVGTVSGNTFTLASSYLTTTVPVSEDGYCYIPIGRLGNTSTGGNYFYFFCVDKPTLYTYKDGLFGPASIREASAAAKTATNYISLDSTGIRIANENPATATTYQHQTAANTEFIVDGVSSAEFSGSGGRIGSYNGVYTVLNNNQLTLAGYANKIFSVEVEDVTPVPEGDEVWQTVAQTSATVNRPAGVENWYIKVNQLQIPFIQSITSRNGTLVENTDYILNKVDGTIYIRNGISTVEINYSSIPVKDYNTSLTLYDGKGIGTNNKLVEISNDSAIIGKPNKSHLRLDYHSMQMIDTNGTPYLYVSDLRDSNGEYEITETIIPDGYTRYFSLSYGPAVSTDYEVVIDDEDTYQITKEEYQFRTNKDVPSGVTITVTYLSSNSSLKAFTFGSRNPNYDVGIHSFAIGSYVTANKEKSFAFGTNARALGKMSFSMGAYSEASGYEAFALGDRTSASGRMSYAEGYQTVSSGYVSHAEGSHSLASGWVSHAEGMENTASGSYTHAEGSYNEASEDSSHVEGKNSVSKAVASHAQNISTIASADGQTVLGTYNQEDPSVIVDTFTGDGSTYSFTLSKRISRVFSVEIDGEPAENFNASGLTVYFQDTPPNGSTIAVTYRTHSTTHPTGGQYGEYGPYGEYAVIVGNGTSDNDRSNALTVDWSGNVDISGVLQAHNGREIFGGSSDSVLLQHKDANDAEDFRIQFYIDSNGHPALRGSLNGGSSWEYPYPNQYASHTANTVWAAPNGSNGVAGFRALVAADIPNLNASKITAGNLDIPGTITSDGAITSGAAIYAHNGQEIFGGTDALIRLYHRSNNSEDFRFDFYIDSNGNPAMRASLDSGSSWKYPYLNQLSSRTANTVLAGPNGSNGAPSFRELVAADIPNLNASKITAGTLGTARGGTGVSGRQSSTITVDTSNVTVGDTNHCWHNGVVCSFSYNFKPKASLANNGTLAVGTLPSGYRPPYAFVGSAYTSTASAQVDVTISTAGVITIRNVSGAAIATSVTIRVGATFAL